MQQTVVNLILVDIYRISESQLNCSDLGKNNIISYEILLDITPDVARETQGYQKWATPFWFLYCVHIVIKIAYCVKGALELVF